MQKTKSSDVNPKELESKTHQNLSDWIFGFNNAYEWWNLLTNVNYKFEWGDAHTEGFARGDQLMDHFLGLVEKYKWEGMDMNIHSEFTWDDGK